MLRFIIAFVSIVGYLSLCTGQPAIGQQLQHQRHLINAEDLSFAIIHSNEKDEDSFGAEWIHLEEDELQSRGQEQCASIFSDRDEELKCRMALHMTGGESGTNGVESVNGWQRQLAEGRTEEKSDKCLSKGASSPPAAEVIKPERTSLRMLLERTDVENAIEEINRDWREKVDKKKVARMEKEFQRMELLRKKQLEKMDVVRPEQLSKTDFRKLLGAQFDPVMFRTDVDNDKPCNEEPLQIAEYYLFRYSNKMGIYHVGLLVCGIEIHFHRPGIEFWKPMEYSTRFVGGIHRDYRTVYYKGRALYTPNSFQFIVSVLKRMEIFFNANTYNVMTRNCLQFVRTLARELTGLIHGEQIDWPWSAIHPLKKGGFAVKKLKQSFDKKRSDTITDNE